MSRDGMQLTAAAQELRDAFESQYGDRGNCSCHLSPPCGSCLHPGNPANQAENEESWEPIPPDPPTEVSPDVTPEKRADVLAEIDAAFDEKVPAQYMADLNAAYAASQVERTELGLSVLTHAMLFVERVREQFPDLDENHVRRCAADAIARAMLVIAKSARRGEALPFTPGRTAMAMYFITEQVIETAAKQAAQGGTP